MPVRRRLTRSWRPEQNVKLSAHRIYKSVDWWDVWEVVLSCWRQMSPRSWVVACNGIITVAIHFYIFTGRIMDHWSHSMEWYLLNLFSLLFGDSEHVNFSKNRLNLLSPRSADQWLLEFLKGTKFQIVMARDAFLYSHIF